MRGGAENYLVDLVWLDARMLLGSSTLDLALKAEACLLPVFEILE
jgi:hypothetical protein